MSRFASFIFRSNRHPERSEGSLIQDSSAFGLRMTGVISDYIALTKPRLTLMVLLSSAVGFYLAASAAVDLWLFVVTLFGTALVASGSMALNQWMERETDVKMVRTQNRPIPAGRIEPDKALVFGSLASLLGFLILVLFVNVISAIVAFATWAAYLFAYTPLKSRSSLCTIVGAVPGALPPVIGWAAVTGNINFHAFLLFLVIFFWQMPHFLAIAWMYREDYRRIRQPILSVVDEHGTFVARQMILYLCALMPVSLLPTLFGLTGTVYFFGAFLLGICFSASVIFAAADLDSRARVVLRSSIAYLGALLILMVFDKI